MPYKVKIPATIYTDDLKKLGDSVVNLSRWCEDEFNEVASSFQATEPDFIWNSVPPKPRRGTYAYADGANWNPGYGEGPYTFNGTLWVPASLGALVNQDLSTTLTATQKQQARQNIYAAPYEAATNLNLYYNSQMNISQEIGFGSFPRAAGTGTYAADGWCVSVNNTASGALTVVSANNGMPSAVAGAGGYVGVTTSTAVSSIAASDYCFIYQPVEGYRMIPGNWGVSSARPITVGFYVYSNGVTGNMSVVARNGAAANRSYPTLVNVPVANSWLWRTVTIPGDVTGTWVLNNAVGFYIFFALFAGSTYSGPPNTWSAANYVGANGATNFCNAAGNALYISQPVLMFGNELPRPDLYPGQHLSLFKQHPDNMRDCERYWQILAPQLLSFPFPSAGQVAYHTVNFITEMRAPPVITQRTAPFNSNLSGLAYGSQIGVDRIRVDLTSSAAGTGYTQNGVYNLDSRL